jgi:hypothetical protein
MREDVFIPEHRTNILPLRWIANYIFHPLSMFFFNIGLRANDRIEWDHQYTAWNKIVEYITFKLYSFFDYPYKWWGTYYKWEFDYDLSGDGWNDYDSDGIPYWEKWEDWDFEDEWTGDAFRIVKK